MQVKNVWAQTFVPKISGPKIKDENNLDKKGSITFWFKNLVSKSSGSKEFGSKKIWGLKTVFQKIFWVQRHFESKRFWG